MTIRPGTRGEHVAALQRFLISCGYLAEGQDDGIWGGISAGALVEFQRSYRLEPDGVPGPATLGILSMGPRSSAVLHTKACHGAASSSSSPPSPDRCSTPS